MNAEIIIAILTLCALLGALAGWLIKLGSRIAALETSHSAHERNDERAHERLESNLQMVLEEVRASRKQSATEHAKLDQRIDAAIHDGASARSQIHSKLNEVGNEVAQLRGYLERAREEVPPRGARR